MAGNLDQAFWQQASQAALDHARQVDARRGMRQLAPRPEDRRWHVVNVAAKFERDVEKDGSFVAKQIEAAGFEVYSPKLRRMVVPPSRNLSRAQRRIKHVLGQEKIEPLFPRYEFVLFDPLSDPWHDIFRIVGVYGMLCANNLPVPIPDVFIAGLKAKEVNGAIPEDVPALEAFSIGETVRVSKPGLFKGLTGQMKRLDADGRIRLLLGLFGGSSADLTIDDIEKI